MNSLKLSSLKESEDLVFVDCDPSKEHKLIACYFFVCSSNVLACFILFCLDRPPVGRGGGQRPVSQSPYEAFADGTGSSSGFIGGPGNQNWNLTNHSDGVCGMLTSTEVYVEKFNRSCLFV